MCVCVQILQVATMRRNLCSIIDESEALNHQVVQNSLWAMDVDTVAPYVPLHTRVKMTGFSPSVVHKKREE